MRYISSRGEAPVLSFDEVLLTGLARDGGLYVPESWPHFDVAALRDMASLSYAELALHLTHPFVGKAIPKAAYAGLVARSYAGFDHDPIAPLRDIGGGVHLMELFHGPTMAFKDYALQLVGQLFEHVLESRGERVTILGATSGDTGSAAIAGCAACPSVDVFILHPKGRVSEVQRRQMTTVTAPNVFNIAIEGDFDDCQDLVKTLFNDTAFRQDLRLSAVNSINWARIMAQTVYYFFAALKLGAPDKEVSFAVPTGNFGNVYAGYVARCMGLPVKRLIIGSNRNDILTRFFESGVMETHEVTPSLSPSMDIQVSSNFERLLFDLFDRDSGRVAAAMVKFHKSGRLTLEPNASAAPANCLPPAASMTKVRWRPSPGNTRKPASCLIPTAPSASMPRISLGRPRKKPRWWRWPRRTRLNSPRPWNRLVARVPRPRYRWPVWRIFPNASTCSPPMWI